MPSSMTDEDMETEMAALEEEDFLEYGIKIRDEGELLEPENDDDSDSDIEEIEYLPSNSLQNSTRPLVPQTNPVTTVKLENRNEGGSLLREPTYTLDMHLFHKRKDKPPLYLLNPDDYPHDPMKQMQIRRATITYRHHQEKKALIRRQADEIANLRSVLQIYSQREDAMAQFCTCESAKKIIKDFNPKQFLMKVGPPPKLPPLPPIRRFGQLYGRPSMMGPVRPQQGIVMPNGSGQSWIRNQNGQYVPINNRMIILRKTPAPAPEPTITTPPTTAFEALKAQRALAAKTGVVQPVIPKTTTEQTNGTEKESSKLPDQETETQETETQPPPPVVIKTEPDLDKEEPSTSSQNCEVDIILQQMKLAQVRMELSKQLEAKREQEGSSPALTKPASAILKRPQISASALARNGLRIQSPDMKLMSPSSSGLQFSPRTIINPNQLIPGRVISQLPPPSALRIVNPLTRPASNSANLKMNPVVSILKKSIHNPQMPPQRAPSTTPTLIIPKQEPVDYDEPAYDESDPIEAMPVSSITIKEEPLDDPNQRRSQRSAAINRPSTKDLLKGIIKNMPRVASAKSPSKHNGELSYAPSAKKSKRSSP